MGEWFDTGLELAVGGAAEAAGVTFDQAMAVYRHLSDLGLIEYDLEKEVFADLAGEEESADA